ncbi:hypothetical protein [Streptomyces sp. NPDC085596]|uniref:hypothetical protein n=1 Tax=Streptomyces sp. NPDC085596 TaxID=3365731 RepID=UPI0037CE291F
MTHEPSLPALIGTAENALRALLTRTLSTTRIKSYPAWVVLNAASAADARNASTGRRRGAGDAPEISAGDALRGAGDALKVDAGVVDEVLAQLAADGLVGAGGSLTALGAAELRAARSAVAGTTARLVEGVGEADGAATRRVLEHVRRTAEDLLSL